MRISDLHNPWRDKLVPASFRGVVFHTEAAVRRSGRRTVVHEYPKRNDPYSEDMGQHAVRFSLTGYLIHNDKRIPNVMAQRDALIRALDADDAGSFQHPSMPSMLVMCESYSHTEVRQKGGYFEFEMHFVDAGKPALVPLTDTVQAVVQSALAAASAARDALRSAISGDNSQNNVPTPPGPG